jgi:hypothetical protein
MNTATYIHSNLAFIEHFCHHCIHYDCPLPCVTINNQSPSEAGDVIWLVCPQWGSIPPLGRTRLVALHTSIINRYEQHLASSAPVLRHALAPSMATRVFYSPSYTRAVADYLGYVPEMMVNNCSQRNGASNYLGKRIEGKSPVMMAADSGDYEQVHTLLHAGATVYPEWMPNVS